MKRTAMVIWNESDTIELTDAVGTKVLIVSRLPGVVGSRTPEATGIILENELEQGGPLTIIITTLEEAAAVVNG